MVCASNNIYFHRTWPISTTWKISVANSAILNVTICRTNSFKSIMHSYIWERYFLFLWHWMGHISLLRQLTIFCQSQKDVTNIMWCYYCWEYDQWPHVNIMTHYKLLHLEHSLDCTPAIPLRESFEMLQIWT